MDLSCIVIHRLIVESARHASPKIAIDLVRVPSGTSDGRVSALQKVEDFLAVDEPAFPGAKHDESSTPCGS